MLTIIGRGVQIGVGFDSLRDERGGGLNLRRRTGLTFESLLRGRRPERPIREPGDSDARHRDLPAALAHARGDAHDRESTGWLDYLLIVGSGAVAVDRNDD